MGLFDRFKKKDGQPKTQPARPQPSDQTAPKAAPQSEPAATSELYPFISRYNEYIVGFITMQQRGNYAPISAYENNGGELIGHLYLGDESYMLSAQQVVDRMKEGFEARLAKGEIRSYAIFYHSQFAGDGNHALADSQEELKAISIVFRFKDGPEGAIALPYRFDDDGVVYSGFAEFTAGENNAVFSTQMEEGKEYYQERISPQPEKVTNAAGIEVTVTNTKDTDNMWGGILGFNCLNNGNGLQLRMEYAALALAGEALVTGENDTTVFLHDFGDVQLRVIKEGEKPRVIQPVVKTDYTIDVENKVITEWEGQGGNIEALIRASGRDTFGIDYYATDYAENRSLYHGKRKLDITISGIAFVLDLYKQNDDSELKYSEEFTAYMPTSQLPNYACFDFVGQIEDLRKTEVMGAEAYLMNMRLITHTDQKDFFTIDVFVHPENMRFATPEKGMKVTGMLQLQGRIRK